MAQQRIYSPKLETSTLRSITEADDVVSSWLFPRVSAEDFSWEPAKDVFKRIRVLTNKTGQVPRWEDLLEDLAISKDARTAIENQNTRVAVNRREAKLIVEKLGEYRRARTFFMIQKKIAGELKSDKIDLDQLGEEIGDMLSRARMGNVEDSIMHFGGKLLAKESLRRLLRGSQESFIPTGIKAFDSQNSGVPRDTAWLLAGPTGGFKSGLSVNIGMNQALFGAKVSFTGLEMSELQINQRMLARLTSMPLKTIVHIDKESKITRRIVIDAWKEFHDRVKKNGGRFTIYTPPEDVTLEDILMRMRPRGYDNNIIDYMGLLKGMDEDDQWRKLGGAMRFAKRFAGATNSIVTALAQLSEDGIVRYSRTMLEHASLAWTWNRPDESGITMIKQPKARMLKPFDFPIQINFSTMSLSDVDISQISVEEKPQQKKRGKMSLSKTKSRAKDETEI